MFGVYSNQRITEAERKILYGDPDDYIWYMVYLKSVFKDARPFQVREDIELPDNGEGVIVMFPGEVAYFRTLTGDATQREADEITRVCLYMEDLFGCPINAYVVCPPDAIISVDGLEGEGHVTINFSILMNDDGERIIDELQGKLENHEEFTVDDSASHMLLPYTGFKNKAEFREKLKHYTDLVNANGEAISC